MKANPTLVLITLFCMVGTASARQEGARGAGQPSQPSQDEVVRISVTLVQVDAVVTDRAGRQVTDLRPDEVKIFEDGRPQRISNFSYIITGSEVPRPKLEGGAPAAPTTRAPPARPEDIRRTIALVVDDLGLSFESFLRNRRSRARTRVVTFMTSRSRLSGRG